MRYKFLTLCILHLVYLINCAAEENPGQSRLVPGMKYANNIEPYEIVLNFGLGGLFKANSFNGIFDEVSSTSLEFRDYNSVLPFLRTNVDFSYYLLHFQIGISIMDSYRIRLIDPLKDHYSRRVVFFKQEISRFPDDAYYQVRSFDFPIKLGVNPIYYFTSEDTDFQFILWGGCGLSTIHSIRTRNEDFYQFKSLRIDSDLKASWNYVLGISGRVPNLLSFGFEYQKSMRDFFKENDKNSWFPGLFKIYIEFEVFNSNRDKY
jgi:hypothetical protein